MEANGYKRDQRSSWFESERSKIREARQGRQSNRHEILHCKALHNELPTIPVAPSIRSVRLTRVSLLRKSMGMLMGRKLVCMTVTRSTVSGSLVPSLSRVHAGGTVRQLGLTCFANQFVTRFAAEDDAFPLGTLQHVSDIAHKKEAEGERTPTPIVLGNFEQSSPCPAEEHPPQLSSEVLVSRHSYPSDPLMRSVVRRAVTLW